MIHSMHSPVEPKPAGPGRPAANTIVIRPNRGSGLGWAGVLAVSAWLLALAAGCATAEPKVARENKEIIRRYFDGWANHGDPAVADALIATNLVVHNPPVEVRSLAEYKESMGRFHQAFPDLHFEPEAYIAEGDQVVVPWTLRATQKEVYRGNVPNGRTMTITGTSIFRLQNGRIQEIRVNMDRASMMDQLGWAPAPSAPARGLK